MATNGRLLLLAALLALAGCVAPQAASPPTAAPVESAGLQTHAGLGYSISCPTGAVVRAGDISPRWMPDVLERTVISGPKVETYTWEGRPSDLSAYGLEIWVYPNPEELDAETWARQRILDDWRRAHEEGLPLGGVPVTDGAIREDRVGRAVVAGYPAFRAAFWGGDSHIVRYYVASGEYVVVLRYEDIPVVNYATGQVMVDVAYLLMSTLRLE